MNSMKKKELCLMLYFDNSIITSMKSFCESRPSPGVSAPFLPVDSDVPYPWQT